MPKDKETSPLPVSLEPTKENGLCLGALQQPTGTTLLLGRQGDPPPSPPGESSHNPGRPPLLHEVQLVLGVETNPEVVSAHTPLQRHQSVRGALPKGIYGSVPTKDHGKPTRPTIQRKSHQPPEVAKAEGD